MTSRRARVVRAMLAAGFSTFTAVLSHSIAAAQAPGTLAVVLAIVFSVLVCLAFTGRRLSLWRLTVAVSGSQLIYHGLFTLFGSSGGVSTVSSGGGLFGPHDHAAMMAQIQALSSGGATSTPQLAAASWMLAAHVFAAALTIVALRTSERAFWGIVDGTRLHLRALFTAAVQPVLIHLPRLRAFPGRGLAFRRKVDLLSSSMTHRGPPLAPTV